MTRSIPLLAVLALAGAAPSSADPSAKAQLKAIGSAAGDSAAVPTVSEVVAVERQAAMADLVSRLERYAKEHDYPLPPDELDDLLAHRDRPYGGAQGLLERRVAALRSSRRPPSLEAAQEDAALRDFLSGVADGLKGRNLRGLRRYVDHEHYQVQIGLGMEEEQYYRELLSLGIDDADFNRISGVLFTHAAPQREGLRVRGKVMLDNKKIHQMTLKIRRSSRGLKLTGPQG